MENKKGVIFVAVSNKPNLLGKKVFLTLFTQVIFGVIKLFSTKN
jgi:hypothetical protein